MKKTNLEIVENLLSGEHSIPVELRNGNGLNEVKYSELISAIKILIEIYQSKDSVPKTLALCFVDISNQFYFSELMYSSSQIERLEDCANELSFLGQELFS